MRLPILPTLGLASATSATLGAVCVLAMPALPARWLCVATFCVVLVALRLAPRARPLAAFALGLAWTAMQGQAALDARLPHAFVGDQRVVFRIEGLPKAGERGVRFDARVLEGALRGRKLRLGWYGDGARRAEPGSQWQATVRLRRPRGSVNPGGFDFERHAVERGLAATGYVRDVPAPVRWAEGAGIDALRDRLSRAMAASMETAVVRPGATVPSTASAAGTATPTSVRGHGHDARADRVSNGEPTGHHGRAPRVLAGHRARADRVSEGELAGHDGRADRVSGGSLAGHGARAGRVPDGERAGHDGRADRVPDAALAGHGARAGRVPDGEPARDDDGRARTGDGDRGPGSRDEAGAHRARFVQALAVGDTRGLDEHDWHVLRATGIAHLIAISGLHVGLVAGFGALLMRGVHRAWPPLGLRVPLPQSAAWAALAWAGAYTALAGFALPTVRTLLMIAAALAGVLLRRASGAAQAFALSLIAVLAFDPLALLGAGFWLSYLGVAWLLWCLPRERAVPAWRALLSVQAVMTVSLFPLGAWFFGQASLAGPLANLVAVPWVSFVVVPVALIGTACELAWEGAGAPAFRAAAWLMDWLWMPMEHAAAWRGAIAWLPEPTPLGLAFALLGAFWLLLPRGVPGKALALFLFLPLAWPATRPPAHGEAEVTMLDVGQGLSLLVRTQGHALVYDAGPAPPGGLDQGEAVVVPALHALGVRRLDAYVESHGHDDHAGGTDAVLRAFAPPRVHASDPARRQAACEGAWTWDGVDFAFLHPPPHFPYLANDSSCVLRIATAGGAILLPGDISATVEERLQREHALAAEVVAVPHHGSGTSSSQAFVDATRPRIALVAAGHGNRFGLPRPQIVRRWRAAGAAVHDTARAGAITLRLGPRGLEGPHARRRTHPRWWREP